MVKKIIEAETYKERLERLYSSADHRPTFVSKGVYMNHDPADNVFGILTKPEGNHFVRTWHFGHNIVTYDGEIFYAKKGAGETPAVNEGASRLTLANPGTETTPSKSFDYGNLASAISGSNQIFDTGYPRSNDNDTNNTDRATNVVSYRVTYTVSAFTASPATVKNGVIHDSGASPGVDAKCICFFAMGGSAFEKTANDTLTFFVNHKQNAV